MVVIYLIIFVFGLTVGSFLNCIIYRLEKGESFLKGRSYCPYCRHFLNWQDLIPLLSFLILKRRCRYCQQKISWQYPLVEISTAILFLSIWHTAVAEISEFLFYVLITSFLIIIFVYDLKHYIISDKIIYPAIIISFLYNLILNSKFLILNSLPVAVGGAFFFLLIVLLSRGRWLGLGDVKLAGLMGLLLGFPNILVGLFLAFCIGAIIGIGLILAGKKTLKSEVPFGPFLVSGTFIALFWGQAIINWYFQLFLP